MAGRLSLAGVLVIALAALFATPAAASDQACTRDVIGHAPVSIEIHPLQAAVEAIFEAPVVTETPAGTIAEGPSQLIMVRVQDGKLVMACTDTKESATRFLSAPIATVGASNVAEEK